MYKELKNCRLCRSPRLERVVGIGEQYLTGIFPKRKGEEITKGPLNLVWCKDCSLLQLEHSFLLDEMYGDNYGYRSGLNASMVYHLRAKIHNLQKLVNLMAEDLVVDIGSNDATSLKAYTGKFKRVGIDPTGNKFASYYTEGIDLISDFFSYEVFKKNYGEKKAKIITSISMFYDLEDPNKFVSDIYSLLDSNGIWHFEQSYMPSMLNTNSYDTICHEHLEFYSFKVVNDLLIKNGMRVIDVQLNSINGGSFAVTACKKEASYRGNEGVINWLLKQEDLMELRSSVPYTNFFNKMKKHKESLVYLIRELNKQGKRIIGYGASTKGNVLLQYCGFTSDDIKCIAEVNEDKYGSYTPGTNIPIVSESGGKKMNPDYFLVLPWHFKESILAKERDFMRSGGKFIFPLPEIEII